MNLRRSIRRLLSNPGKIELSDITAVSLDQAPSILRKFGVVVIKDIFKDYMKEPIDTREIKFMKSFDSSTISDDYACIVGPIERGKKLTFIKSRNKYISVDRGIIDNFKVKPESVFQAGSHQIIDTCKQVLKATYPNLHLNYFCNLYQYRTVRTPRCFHRDSLKFRIKCFIPLTVCSAIEQGPYAILPKSHKNKLYALSVVLLNLLFGSDIGNSLLDATLTDSDSMLPLFHEKGDLIITRQDCIHGDFPCNVDNYSREAFVINFLDS